MKRNLPVTQVEREYPAEERLISETDLRGIVTTANTSFCDVAGFTQEELVGQSHNLVRHPDVPPEAFADLWRTLKAGERWVGVIKNRCKNGDHYWVKAFVSPVVQDGRVVRYRSVRRKPSRAEIQAAEELYRRLWAGEKGLMDTLGAIHRKGKLGERISLGAQLALVAGWPFLMALAVVGGALAGAPAALLWSLALAGGAGAAGLALWAYRGITRPLAELEQTLTAFEQGDLTARAPVHGRSRFADMARVMNRALDGVEVAVADMGQMLDSLARGEFGRRIVATLPGELERIKASANQAVAQIEETVTALNEQLASLADGNLDVSAFSADDAMAQGKFREARENAAMAASRLAVLLREMVASTQAMAAGDLTRPLRAEASGELAVMAGHFNSALESLAETVRTMKANARFVAEATTEISGAIEEIAAGAGDQLSTVEQVTQSARESGETIAEVIASAAEASAKSNETVATVSDGRSKMSRMVAVVQSIAESSEKISHITGAIEEIANKTNLLALNAAIEAARAGENGRGFAVVAAEVGKLAVSAAKSAREITDLVRTAVVEAREAAMSVSEVSSDMDRIEAAARESSELLSRTAAAMEQQRATLEAIGDHAYRLSGIAQGVAAATEQLAASSTELARVADATYRQADQFQT